MNGRMQRKRSTDHSWLCVHEGVRKFPWKRDTTTHEDSLTAKKFSLSIPFPRRKFLSCKRNPSWRWKERIPHGQLLHHLSSLLNLQLTVWNAAMITSSLTTWAHWHTFVPGIVGELFTVPGTRMCELKCGVFFVGYWFCRWMLLGAVV